MWDIILNPMVTLLALMYSVFGNNVIMAIVVLTVIIRMGMYPLLAKQQESAAQMQELQPRLKKLQEKYNCLFSIIKIFNHYPFTLFNNCLPFPPFL